MSSEWASVSISEIAGDWKGSMAVGPFGSRMKADLYVPSGVRVIRGNNLSGGREPEGNYVYVTEQTADSLASCCLKPGDLVFPHRGNIGEVGITPDDGLRYMLSTSLMKLSPDRKKAEPLYLMYFFKSAIGRAALLMNASQVGTPGIATPLRSLRGIQLPLPPPVVQRQIADTLSKLDDRITLLRETNATLEAIAQALFKSWFVDFDPVRAKLEGRTPEGMDEATAALFPDGFEESELGLVPRGWKVMPMGQLCSVTIGGLWGKDEQEEVGLTRAISLRGVDLEHLRIYGFAEKAPVRWVKDSAMEKRRLNETQVLVASSGAGPCGRPLWGGVAFEALYGMPVIFSNFVKRLDCETSGRAIFIDRMLANMRETREIWNYINGTSIPNLDDRLLLATKKVLLPSNEILSAFETISRTFYELLYSQQAQTLATLRDTLLPRLISGQLRLPEAKSLIEESVA